MKHLTVFIILFLVSIAVSAQDNEYSLTEKEVKYLFISDISVGQMKYFEDFDNDYEAGFKNRIVITRFELTEKLYLEKIIVDVEAIPSKIEWCKMIELKPLIEKYLSNREQLSFSDIEWKNYNEFDFSLNNLRFSAVILNDNKVKIEKLHNL